MTSTLGGLVFPQDVLVSPWFLLLATVVAFNTIIYLGLTISKFIPWPRQFKPRNIRKILHRFGALPDEDGASPVTVATAHVAVEPYEKIRADITRRDVPMSMALVGVAMVAISVVNFLLSPDNVNPSHIAQLLLGLVFVVMALVTGRRHSAPGSQCGCGQSWRSWQWHSPRRKQPVTATPHPWATH